MMKIRNIRAINFEIEDINTGSALVCEMSKQEDYKPQYGEAWSVVIDLQGVELNLAITERDLTNLVEQLGRQLGVF